MIINVDWDNFQARFMLEFNIYVVEHEHSYEFITYDGILIIRCFKLKGDNQEENMIFIERELTNKKNLMKVSSFEEEGMPELVPEDPMPISEVIETEYKDE